MKKRKKAIRSFAKNVNRSLKRTRKLIKTWKKSSSGTKISLLLILVTISCAKTAPNLKSDQSTNPIKEFDMIISNIDVDVNVSVTKYAE